MRTLDATNPIQFKPGKFAGVGAVLPILLSLICLPLVLAVDPDTPPLRNPIILALAAILAASCFMLVWPSVFKWDWRTKYFGVLSLYLGSVPLIGFVPCVCIVFYGSGAFAVRACLLLIYGTLHVIWCRRFVVAYSDAIKSAQLRSLIYQEDADAVYYMQRGDRLLLEKELKFKQIPGGSYFLIFISAAVALTLLQSWVRTVFGVPFFHVFLLVSMLPVSLTFSGFAVHGLLVFYLYPAKIERASGKRVYVDMSGPPNIVAR